MSKKYLNPLTKLYFLNTNPVQSVAYNGQENANFRVREKNF